MKEREIELTITQSNFSLIWTALHDRENKLLQIIETHGEDSEEAALAANDVIYLRLYKKHLKEKAEGVFFPSAFIVDDRPI